jgi:hypothetical protein
MKIPASSLRLRPHRSLGLRRAESRSLGRGYDSQKPIHDAGQGAHLRIPPFRLLRIRHQAPNVPRHPVGRATNGWNVSFAGGSTSDVHSDVEQH